MFAQEDIMKTPATQRPPLELKLAEKRARTRKGRRLRHRSTTQRSGDRAAGDDDGPRKFLTGPEVRDRYGICGMTLYRWIKRSTMGFPPPTFVINKYRYWDEAILREWELQRARADDRRPQ